MALKEKVGQTIEFAGVTFGYLNPVTLKPNALNYQTHPDEQRQALSDSIEEFGWVGFPIFNQQTKRLVDGHARVEEARKRKEAGIICVMVDLPEEREKRLLLSYDRIGRMAVADDAMLSRLLRDCGTTLPPGWDADTAGDILLRIAGEDTEHLTSSTQCPEKRERRRQDPEDAPDIVHQSVSGDVQTVQLFYPAERAQVFKQMVEFLKDDLGQPTMSDTVFEVLRDAYEGRG